MVFKNPSLLDVQLGRSINNIAVCKVGEFLQELIRTERTLVFRDLANLPVVILKMQLNYNREAGFSFLGTVMDLGPIFLSRFKGMFCLYEIKSGSVLNEDDAKMKPPSCLFFFNTFVHKGRLEYGMKFGIQKMALLFVFASSLIFGACYGDSSSANNLLSSGGEEITSSSSVTGSSFGKANWAYLNQDIFYGEFTDDRDGQVYKTTAIGFQNWMAENLNYADSVTTPSLKGRSWCYENSGDSCAKYGRLYTWAAAIDSGALYNDKGLDCGYGKACSLPDTVYGICPEGWHLPTRAEWDALCDFVDYEQNIGVGMALKSKSGWTNYSVTPTGKDAYGFSALPAGLRQNDGMFYFVCYDALFLSSSEYDSSAVYIRFLDSYDENFNKVWNHKNFAGSVRCLQN